MDRRAAGALLALAACIACSAAAPTASNHTALDLYEGASEGCYYNFQHYGEGDRIMTNEPCLNCTCHNRMLMCYLRVCPFTKPIGQDCTVEKRADQCCPIVTCPDVPVDLLTSTSTSSPAEYGATGLGKLDKYGCSISGKYFPEGSKVPPTPNKPCEHCYCIRNMTTCVMQECTLHVDGCTPIYHKDVCCPVRYSCDHLEDELPLLDDMSTTVRPTPGFLLTTTTMSPVTQMTQDCVHNDQIIADGASITTDKACEHCYCMKGDIVCVVQECGAPMENEGKNCTSLPPREGQCCPDTYICEGDEPNTEVSTESATESILEKLTTLQPPRRAGVEGSGYRNEPNEAYTEAPTTESELEGSGEEQEPTQSTAENEATITEKPQEITPILEEDDQYIPVTTKAPTAEETEATTKEIERNVIDDGDLVKETSEPEIYHPTTQIPVEKDVDEMASGVTESEEPSHKHVTTTGTLVSEKYDQHTTEPGESLNTVPDTVAEKEHDKPHEFTPSTTGTPIVDENEPDKEQGVEEPNITTSSEDQDVTLSPISEHVSKPEFSATSPENVHETEIGTTEKSHKVIEETVGKESDISGTTSAPTEDEIRTISPETPELVSAGDVSEEKDMPKVEQNIPSTTSTPLEDIEKLTTEPNHAQNTVDVAEDESYPHVSDSKESEKTTTSNLGDTVTEKVFKEEDMHEPTSVEIPVSESKTTVEPDKGLNTIPSETDEESSSQSSLVDKTASPTVDAVEPQESDIKTPTASEPSSTLTDTHVTKVDQYTITTEPSFRKEDEISVSTEKSKEEPASTTIKAEFIDEGLIPTSSHDEKLGTGSDMSTMDEDITTVSPEYNTEIDETVETKQPTTQSIPEISIDTGSSPNMAVESTREPEVALVPSTEKDEEVTTTIPDVESHQEPSRIPGEGDCLLNSVTYKNNTVVPSTNNCHTACKCISSIIKCDPIICSPPPDYMDNCQSIYDAPDSCCPTYVCDHPRETIPPQSDNQMSGTEPPVPPPTIECRGDQCELSEPAKPTGSSEPCATGNCLPAADDKTTTQCGPEGCDGLVKEPPFSQPSDEHSECIDGKCEISAEGCADGKCDLPSVVSPAVKPCVGDDCAVPAEEMPASQLCENGSGCEKTEIPVTHTIPSHDSHQAPCKEEDGCKPQEVIPSGCTGEEPCRRVETPIIDQSPSKCQGSDCVQETNVSVTEDMPQINTESSVPQETSSEPVKEHTIVEEEKPEQEIVTEREYTPTEHYTTIITEKASEMQDIATEKPVSTKSPNAIEEYTNEPISESSTEEYISERPDVPQEEQVTQMPDEIEKEQLIPDDSDKENTDKLSSVDAGSDVTEEYTDKTTQIPDGVKKHTDVPGTSVPDVTDDFMEKSTKIPDTDVTALETDLDKKEPDAAEAYTNKPTMFKEDESETPNVAGMELTEKPLSIKEQESKTTISTSGVHTDKPITMEDEGTKTPDVTEEYTDKLTEKPESVKEHTDEPTSVTESETKVPDFLDEHSTDSGIVKEEDTKAPDALIEDHTDKPLSVEKQETKIPDAVEETTDKIAPVEGEGTKIPVSIDEYSEKPTEVPDIINEHSDGPITVDESSTKLPDTVLDHTEEAVTVYEEGTKIPDHGEEDSKKQPPIKEPEREIPEITDEEQIGDVSPTEAEGTKIPEVTEKYELTNIPEVDTTSTIPSEEQSMKIPDELTDKTDEQKPGVSESDDTTEPITEKEESTENIESMKESSTKKPIIIDDDIEGSTDDQPVGSKVPSTKPVVVDTDQTFTSADEEHTSKPDQKPEPTLSYQGQEDSSTKTPEIHVPQSEILSEEHTKPYTETVTSPQISVSDDDLATESNVEIKDTDMPEVTSVPGIITSEFSDGQETQPQDVDKNIPTESAPEILTEHEGTTKGPLDETISQDTSIHVPDDEQTRSPLEPATSPQELYTTKMPELIVTTESVEKVTISKDQETITERAEIYTDIPERATLTTESPKEEITKPQEGTQPKLPDPTMTESTEAPEKEFIQPALESHITETESAYESTSALPEPEIIKETDIPEVFEDKTEKTTMPETQDSESEKTPTRMPFGTSDQDTKSDESGIFTPEKEQMITSTKDTAVTEPTMSSSTDIKDSSITGDEDTSTGYYGETTEKLEPTITIDASSVVTSSTSETPLLIDTKTTKAPEVFYTNAHDVTDTPTEAETKPADSNVSDKSETNPAFAVQESTTSQSPELPQVTSESSISGEPHRRTEITESNEIAPETTERPISELPVSIVTEPEEKPIVDNSVPEEKTTETVDLINLDASTVPPAISITNAPAATEIPEAHITASSKPEESKATESSYIQPDITESQETGTKSEESDTTLEKTTRSPEIPVKSEDTESDIGTPLPGVQQPSTDYPTTVVEIRTELPQIQITTETPQSLVTEYHEPDIDVTTKEQDYKDPSLHETELKLEEEITEKTELTVTEVTTSKQLEEVTKPAEQTLAQAEFSETTPYPIVELEEHTHRTQEDITTISPVDEKEHTIESGEVTSTQLPPSKEEDTIAQDVTADEERLSTVSPLVEEYTQKIPEEVPAVSSPTDELTTSQPDTGIQGTKAPSEVKPDEDIETTAKPIDIPSGLSEESSTILGVVSDQTTLPVPEEASESVSESYTSTKPTREESTGVPPVVQDDDQKDITTSKPTHDLEEIPSVIPTESSNLGSDIEATTEKDISATEKPSDPHIHEASDKTPIPEDELIYSTTKPTTVMQEDLLTPSSEDKYTKPEEKPTSEVLPPSSTAEVPKPSAEIEPTEEIPAPEDDGHFPPSATGYGEDYGEEDQAFGPGTCRYGGKVYVSAQQIPRDDPCDFCFCFRSDIICLQQSCPPPIHGCHEEPIQGFCCPRYECPVSMATTVNVTTTTTTTTTTLPPHFPTHSYKGAAQRRGCQIKGHTYKVGEVVRSASGPCLHCKCGGDGQMKCDPKACTPEPMLRQMIAAAVSAKRRR